MRTTGTGSEPVERTDISKAAPERPVLEQTTRANKKPDIAPFIEPLDVPPEVLDLRALPSRRLRVVGSSHQFTGQHTVWTWQLQREPKNRYDSNAIAVRFTDGRRAGYVSANQAKTYAPLLDASGYSMFFVSAIGSEGTTSSRIWVDLPTTPALRRFLSRG